MIVILVSQKLLSTFTVPLENCVTSQYVEYLILIPTEL